MASKDDRPPDAGVEDVPAGQDRISVNPDQGRDSLRGVEQRVVAAGYQNHFADPAARRSSKASSRGSGWSSMYPRGFL